MAPWERHTVAEAVRRVAATTKGAALYSELKALGWWWGGTRESIDRAKRYVEESPNRARIRWLLSELYDLELAELERLADQPAEPAPTSGEALPDEVEDTLLEGIEGTR